MLATIVRELTPYLGANMARAAAHMNCEKLGFLGEELSAREIEQLLDALAPGMHVFIGKKKTEDALSLVRRALTAGGGGP